MAAVRVMCRSCRAITRRAWVDRCDCEDWCSCGGYGRCPKGCAVAMRPVAEVREQIAASEAMDAQLAGFVPEGVP